MNREKNERYLETDRRIRAFVLEELNARPLRDITVTEVCRRLGLNRSSFYLHYPDVFAVAETIYALEMDELNAAFLKISELGGTFDPMAYLPVLLRLIKNHPRFYNAYFGETGLEQLQIHSDRLLRDLILPRAEALGLSLWETEMRFLFVSAGVCSVCRKWLSDGCRESPEKIAELIQSVIDPSVLNAATPTSNETAL